MKNYSLIRNLRKIFSVLLINRLSVLWLFAMLLLVPTLSAQDEIKLLVRGDDIGYCHTANMACIDAYNKGIMRSVEVMVPCPWFTEAARLLRENPGLDVGVHLTFTSEWDEYKWRPLTCAPTLTDENGNFFPMVWANDDYPPEEALQSHKWDINEIEKEMRAQIELAMKEIPQVTHLSAHMGWTSMSEDLDILMEKLAREYGLYVDMSGVQRMGNYQKAKGDSKQTIENFIVALQKLEPGTYLFVEHPGYDTPEQRAIRHNGYADVATDRNAVTMMFTSEEVKKVIEKNNIRLISYKDIKESQQ